MRNDTNYNITDYKLQNADPMTGLYGLDPVGDGEVYAVHWTWVSKNQANGTGKQQVTHLGDTTEPTWSPASWRSAISAICWWRCRCSVWLRRPSRCRLRFPMRCCPNQPRWRNERPREDSLHEPFEDVPPRVRADCAWHRQRRFGLFRRMVCRR